MLEEALNELSGESRDGHISDLAARARALEAEGGWEVEGGAKLGFGEVLHKVGSTEEQEEVEKVV
jgi:HD-GYP domain-containing protein (c-di-GMP phosphodiesterase class II)